MHIILSIMIKIVISLLCIFLGHQLWNYIKDNYSTKKTNYLVCSQINKYKTMIQEIQETKIEQPVENNDLKNDLEQFMQEL